MIKQIQYKDYLLLFVLTLAIYWPLTFNLLSLKNDAVIFFLPCRYHISEAIQHGYFPFWSPYFYTGHPLHADMQSGVWNPVVLLFSLFGRYNMTMLQWEVLLYFYTAAVGMYRLIKHLGSSSNTALICAVSFICCGYMTDSVSVILWVSSASFIPFVLLYFLKLLDGGKASVVLKLSLALSLLFLCGYPSFFIALNYIIAIGFTLWAIRKIKAHLTKAVSSTLLKLVAAYILFLLVCSPAIVSYVEFLPYYSRGSGLNFEKASTNPMHFFSTVTYLLPAVISKADFVNTDMAMRNTYIGLFVFLFFLLSLRRLHYFKKIVIAGVVLSFLFSLGNTLPVQEFCFRFVPMVNTFRHPGTMRVFTCIGMICIAAYAINDVIKGERNRWLDRLSYLFVALFLITSAYLFFLTRSEHSTFQLELNPASLKAVLYGLTFKKFAFLITVLQIFFLIAFLLLRRKKIVSPNLFTILTITNSVVFAWIAFPFTVVSQYKTSEVNAFIKSFPAGYPIPHAESPIRTEASSDSASISIHGYRKFYEKEITIQDHVITPTLASDYDLFLNDQQLRSTLKNHPFAFVSNKTLDDHRAKIKIQAFTPNRFVFHVQTDNETDLNLFQQYNHNWQAKVNQQVAPIQKSNIAFMKVPVPKGISTIELSYRPKTVYLAMAISICSLLAAILYFVFNKKKANV